MNRSTRSTTEICTATGSYRGQAKKVNLTPLWIYLTTKKLRPLSVFLPPPSCIAAVQISVVVRVDLFIHLFQSSIHIIEPELFSPSRQVEISPPLHMETTKRSITHIQYDPRGHGGIYLE